MKIKSDNNSEITTLISDSDKFIKLSELIEKVKSFNVGDNVILFSCGENFLSEYNEYYGCKVIHLPTSDALPKQNNKIYIIPVNSDKPIKYVHHDYEIVENESNEFEAVKKYNVTKEEAEAFKEYLQKIKE